MADDRDWEKELAKIDRQIGSLSDAQLAEVAAQRQQPPDSPRQQPVAARLPAAANAPPKQGGRLGSYLRVGLSLGLGVSILFWPYGNRCGWGLVGYLGVAALISITGAWGSVHTWKTRIPGAHVVSLLLTLWGMVLGAREILPRIGYAIPTEAHPAVWLCS